MSNLKLYKKYPRKLKKKMLKKASLSLASMMVYSDKVHKTKMIPAIVDLIAPKNFPLLYYTEKKDGSSI